MFHIDLFSGIGGFALAAETVWPGIEHIFCDNDTFCQAVLKKHWPNAQIYDDIRTLTNPACGEDDGREKRELVKTKKGGQGSDSPAQLGNKPAADANTKRQLQSQGGGKEKWEWPGHVDILTGGFPCQPFSAAGRRRGTADDRYLWPEMFRVIREFQPTWVVAENVRGLVTWNEGLVLEQVCTDLESEGYEVQPIIIPAVAVNAPHRRDRVWIIANRPSDRRERGRATVQAEKGLQSKSKQARELAQRFERPDSNATDTDTGWLRRHERPSAGKGTTSRSSWESDWLEVATRLCSVDDGLPGRMGDATISKPRHRKEQLKAYGNAIVPQVAMEIFQSIKLTYL